MLSVMMTEVHPTQHEFANVKTTSESGEMFLCRGILFRQGVNRASEAGLLQLSDWRCWERLLDPVGTEHSSGMQLLELELN